MQKKVLRRWLPWLAFVLVFTIGTSLLSWWQFARREERLELIAEVITNYGLPAVGFDELLPTGEWRDDLEWRSVTLSGEYLTEHAHLVRNRPLAGRPGFLMLVPFRLDDGRIIAVERGWLATGSRQDNPDRIPKILEPRKQIEVRLRAGEPDLNRSFVAGQLASIDLPELAERIDSDSLIVDFYGRVVSELPVEPEVATPMPDPSLSEGNHLSYALQWILFGVMAISALIWAVRNEHRQRLVATGKLMPVVRRVDRAQQDANEEDALIEEAARRG